MKKLASLVVLALPLISWGASSSPDAHFYRAVAQSGIAEVEAGKLAQQKAVDPALAKFGAMMVKDHSAANDQLKALGQSKDVSLPSSSSVEDMAAKAKLELLSGASFDKAYIKNQISAHQDAIKLLQHEISSGQDSDAQAFARKILPTVRSHLAAIQQLAAAAAAPQP
jgi:putative membrane protein